jgi:hypothetical protein
MALRLESIYSWILPVSPNAGVHGRRQSDFHSTNRPWHYLSGLCFGRLAGYDSLLVGFEIVDKRFLLHREPPRFGVLNFTKAVVSN